MKKTVIDILLGFVIIVAVTLLEFLVTIPFGYPSEISGASFTDYISLELLITALPSLLVTFLFAWILKTNSKSDALRRSIIWTAVLLLNYFLIGLGNGNLLNILSAPGLYVLLLCTFAGPFIYSKIKRLD